MNKAKVKYTVKIGENQTIHEVTGFVIGTTTVKDKTHIVFTTSVGFVFDVPINDIITCKIID